jgi:uncharacterized membrane-anchored protein YhcB (DUF1043 family)
LYLDTLSILGAIKPKSIRDNEVARLQNNVKQMEHQFHTSASIIQHITTAKQQADKSMSGVARPLAISKWSKVKGMQY